MRELVEVLWASGNITTVVKNDFVERLEREESMLTRTHQDMMRKIQDLNREQLELPHGG